MIGLVFGEFYSFVSASLFSIGDPPPDAYTGKSFQGPKQLRKTRETFWFSFVVRGFGAQHHHFCHQWCRNASSNEHNKWTYRRRGSGAMILDPSWSSVFSWRLYHWNPEIFSQPLNSHAGRPALLPNSHTPHQIQEWASGALVCNLRLHS